MISEIYIGSISIISLYIGTIPIQLNSNIITQLVHIININNDWGYYDE